MTHEETEPLKKLQARLKGAFDDIIVFVLVWGIDSLCPHHYPGSPSSSNLNVRNLGVRNDGLPFPMCSIMFFRSDL